MELVCVGVAGGDCVQGDGHRRDQPFHSQVCLVVY